MCKCLQTLAISGKRYYNDNADFTRSLYFQQGFLIKSDTHNEKGYNMKKLKKIITILAAAAAVSALPLSGGMTASAATVDDVIAAAYAAGWPDWMVQEAVNMFAGGDYTSEQCDKAIAQIYQYNEAAAKEIEEQFGITPPSSVTTKPAQTTAAGTGSQGGAVTTTTVTTQVDRPSDQTFIDASLEEKKEYLNSMTEEEKQEFINTMTDKERNSVLKQLSASDKAALISSFMEVGKEFGINFSIDDISGDSLTISASDENGKLVNVSSMSISVDPTGKSYTIPVVVGGGMLLISAAGIAFLLKGRKQED